MGTNKKKEKTLAVRLYEMTQAYKQMQELGLPAQLEGIDEFRRIANRFVKEGESASGELRLDGFQRVIIYDLSNQAHIPSRVLLRFKENV